MGAGLGSPSPDVEAVVAQFGAFQNSCSEDCAAFLLPAIVCQRPLVVSGIVFRASAVAEAIGLADCFGAFR